MRIHFFTAPFLSHRPCKIQRIHRASILAHFEMHMRTGAVAAAAGVRR